MTRPTLAECIRDAERLREQNTLCGHAINLLARHAQPNAVETVRDHGDKYIYRAFDVCASHGGILLVTYVREGQRSHTTAHYLDRYLTEGRAMVEHRVAVERLRRKARTLQEAHVQ
jgi:hypothetical protein